METIDTQTWIILVAAVGLGLVAIGAWFYRKSNPRSSPTSSRSASARNTTEP